jgi:hypothetical protein
MQSSNAAASARDQVDELENLPVQMGFEYGVLPAEIRAEARTAADEIKTLIRESVIKVGTALSRIKDRLPHGQFGKWLSAEFGLTERTAQNYMNAAALASKSETVSFLRPKTLYLLASPSTPDSIRQTVIERFEAGQPIPDQAIRNMVQQAKVQQKEEQQRAEEAAHEARLSPRTRRSRAQRQAEQERQHHDWERERAEKEEATNQAADLLISNLAPDSATPLRDLLQNCDSFKLIGALLNRLNANRQPLPARQSGAQGGQQMKGIPTRNRPAPEARASEAQPETATEAASATVTNIFEDDGEIIDSEPYQKAVNLFNAQPDKTAALAFARNAYGLKRSGEFPKEPTEWQSFCWNLPDNVRGVFVRRTSVPPQV